MIQDLSCQNKYSWWRMVLYSWVSYCSSEYKNTDGFLVKATWSPRSLANRRFLCWKIFPNWVLFHTQICFVKKSRRWGNLDKEEDADGIFAKACQLFSIMVGKEGSVNHICSKRKGLGDFRFKGSVINKMRQWSDLTLGRWCISAVVKRIFHSALPNPLSNHSFILQCQSGLLLVQVKRGPWKPRSWVHRYPCNF